MEIDDGLMPLMMMNTWSSADPPDIDAIDYLFILAWSGGWLVRNISL